MADPFLLAVQDPGIALALRRRRHAGGGSRTDERLRESEAADLFEANPRRPPLLLLLFRPAEIDAAHRQPGVDAEERRDRRIDARELHLNEAQERETFPAAAVTLDRNAADVQLLERGQQLEGKGVLEPVLPDDRRDLGLGELPDLFQDVLFFSAQCRPDVVEVAVRRRQRLALPGVLVICWSCCCCGWRCHLTTPFSQTRWRSRWRTRRQS